MSEAGAGFFDRLELELREAAERPARRAPRPSTVGGRGDRARGAGGRTRSRRWWCWATAEERAGDVRERGPTSAPAPVGSVVQRADGRHLVVATGRAPVAGAWQMETYASDSPGRSRDGRGVPAGRAAVPRARGARRRWPGRSVRRVSPDAGLQPAPGVGADPGPAERSWSTAGRPSGRARSGSRPGAKRQSKPIGSRGRREPAATSTSLRSHRISRARGSTGTTVTAVRGAAATRYCRRRLPPPGAAPPEARPPRGARRSSAAATCSAAE